MNKTYYSTITGIFIIIGIGVGIFNRMMPDYSLAVLGAGNIVMAILSLASFMLVKKQSGKNAAAFVRGVSGASLLKLMVCIVGVLVYGLINRANIHKPTIFVLMGIYAIYAAAETILLSKMARAMK